MSSLWSGSAELDLSLWEEVSCYSILYYVWISCQVSKNIRGAWQRTCSSVIPVEVYSWVIMVWFWVACMRCTWSCWWGMLTNYKINKLLFTDNLHHSTLAPFFNPSLLFFVNIPLYVSFWRYVVVLSLNLAHKCY